MARFFVERELAISPVIYVPGNHEYYSGRSRASIDGDWREIAAEHPDLHYLVADGVDRRRRSLLGRAVVFRPLGYHGPIGPGDGA